MCVMDMYGHQERRPDRFLRLKKSLEQARHETFSSWVKCKINPRATSQSNDTHFHEPACEDAPRCRWYDISTPGDTSSTPSNNKAAKSSIANNSSSIILRMQEKCSKLRRYPHRWTWRACKLSTYLHLLQWAFAAPAAHTL